MAPSAFLASTAASTDLVHHIVPPHLCDAPLPNHDEDEALWSKDHSFPPPEGEAQVHQKSWDSITVASVADNLLETKAGATGAAGTAMAAPLIPKSENYLKLLVQ